MKDRICFLGFLMLAIVHCPSAGGAVLGPGSWAVLVAGASGWKNYWSQSDICHTYQAILQKGIKKENIITIMADDIAQNPKNPHRGTVLHRPGGPDVYKGVNIDYSGELVTPETFLNVLLGKESEMKNVGSGRVLKSGKNDTVFINFSGDGGPGFIEFPNKILFANDLIPTLHTMNEENKFGKLVFYLDSCYSGSMFDNLIEHFDNVLAITSAATNEFASNTYCNCNGYLGVCMAGLFEIIWADRLEQHNVSETIFDNYDALRTAVNESHVQIYGDYKLGFLEEFTSGEKSMKKASEHVNVGDSQIPVSEAQLYMAKMDAMKATGREAEEKWEHYTNILKARHFADNLLTTIMEKFTEGDTVLKKELENERYPLNLDMFDCYKRIVSSFNESCFPVPENSYLKNHLYKFANICILDLKEDKAISAMRTVCQENIEQIREVGTVI